VQKELVQTKNPDSAEFTQVGNMTTWRAGLVLHIGSQQRITIPDHYNRRITLGFFHQENWNSW